MFDLQALVTLAVFIGIFAVITLRSVAVYSQFFVSDEGLGTKTEICLRWFRFYKPGFSKSLGMVSAWLSLSAFAHGSYPWGFANAVFAFAAFTDFDKYSESNWMREIRAQLNHPIIGPFVYIAMPVIIAGGLSQNWQVSQLSGSIFEVPGAYLLAVGFLSMKMKVWGEESHNSLSYLTIVFFWDLLLLSGALIDRNTPFIILEGYAICLDSLVAILIVSRKMTETIVE